MHGVERHGCGWQRHVTTCEERCDEIVSGGRLEMEGDGGESLVCK
jgi:hypothetical protein